MRRRPRTFTRSGKPKRAEPEAALQIDVKEYLCVCLPDSGPDGVRWSASLTGTYLSPAARSRAKAMGVRPGIPDLCFVFPGGVTKWIELKAPKGSLEPEQRDFRDHVAPHGHWALCRSVDEVAATLRGWGAPLRDHPFGEGAPAQAVAA
jgi:hypothetical protein